MDVNIDESRASFVVVAVSGEIDVAVAPTLRDKLLQPVNQGHYRVIVDLSAVDFIDSTGISVLVHLLNRLRAHGGLLRVVVTKPHIRMVFEVTGLVEALAVGDSLEDALGA